MEWVKRRRRFNPVGPLVLTLIVAFAIVLSRHGTALALTWIEMIFFFLIVFGLLYLSRILIGKYILITPSLFDSSDDEFMICANCHTVQSKRGANFCACGGGLEPLDHWQWTNSNDAQQQGQHI